MSEAPETTHSDVDILRRFSGSYEAMRDVCTGAQRMSGETLARCIEGAALCASTYHPGRVLDGSIENLALRLGQRLENDRPAAAVRNGGGRRRVLHVTPFVWHTGGHTRTLMNWIKTDRSSEHSLVLTQSIDPMLQGELAGDVEGSGGTVIVLPPLTALLTRARLLRQIARRGFDLIVLHHTCNDVVPVIAFAVADLPPVAFVNDCDQAFWFGASVADVVISQRQAGERVCRERRRIPLNITLPIPLIEAAPPLTREQARAALGITEDQRMLLTVGRAIKYRPGQPHDFMRTAKRVLDAVPAAHLFVVGLAESDADRWGIDYHHPRISLCGPQPDPPRFHAAADLYLESMPFGSATAALEAAQAGVPIVLPYAPPLDLFVTNHGLEQILSNPDSEDAYVAHVVELLQRPDARADLGRQLHSHMRRHHTGEGWRRDVERVYEFVERQTHTPRPLESTSLETTGLDLALSGWQALLGGRDQAPQQAARFAGQTLLNAARLARGRRDYAGAGELLRRYRRAFGVDRQMLLAAIGLPIHRIAKGWRKRPTEAAELAL